HTVITGATWTPESTILAALAVDDGAHVFTIEPGELEDRLTALSTLKGATVTVSLPDEVRVAVEEREPLLAWRTVHGTYLVDGDGTLFADLGAERKEPAADLPV